MQLSELTSRFILRRLADINANYLPTKEEFVVFCRLSAPQMEMYKGMCISLKTLAEEPTGGGGRQTLRCITALKKLCNHPELIYRVYQVCLRCCPCALLLPPILMMAFVTQEEEGNRELIQPVIHHLAPYGAFKTPLAELSGKTQFLCQLLINMRDTTTDRIVVVSNYTQVHQ